MNNQSQGAGKVVAITGAATGIGRGIAERFATEGATVVLLDRSDKVEQAAQAIVEGGGTAVGRVADVTSEQEVHEAFAWITELFGGLDVLINNAGIIDISPVEEISVDTWNQVLAVNTTGTFLCTQAAIQHMRSAGTRGRILNAASGQARQGFIYTPHYAASKFGVIGLTQSLAKEVAPDGITVNAYCPGIIGSDMWDYNDDRWGKLLGDYQPGELMREWIGKIPMGRPGTADDIADLLLFLASDSAGYITGQAINIDGGMFMS